MIIRDFTDNDLYKFSVMNAIQKKFPDAEVVYRFVNRGETPFPEGFGEALRREVDAMRTLFLTDTAEAFMRRRCYYFDNVFFDLLKGFRFNPAEVTVVQEGGRLEVEVRGLWYRTVLWEVPLMAMISELYYRMTGATPAADADDRARAKARRFEELGAELSEFGTRRRFSFEVQDRVIGILKECMPRVLNGTSNVYLAMLHDLIPMGTHPHEWFMYHGAHYGYRVANEMAMENWVDVYDGYLGIALPDTFTSTDFFKSFSTKYAKLFDATAAIPSSSPSAPSATMSATASTRKRRPSSTATASTSKPSPASSATWPAACTTSTASAPSSPTTSACSPSTSSSSSSRSSPRAKRTSCPWSSSPTHPASTPATRTRSTSASAC